MNPAPNPHATLIASLQNPALYDHPVEKFEIVETHISTVLLTGRYAYKIKKPLNLGFLDFSTLEQRRHFCNEELRLNRRLAPQLYLDVVAIGGSAAAPVLNGGGPAIEYAVKMRQFDQAGLLDRMLARGELLPAHIDTLAQDIATFHGAIPSAPADSGFGAPQSVQQPAMQNFEQIRALLKKAPDVELLETLRAWTEQEFAARAEDFAARKQGGFVRECHGDLHLGNMALIDGRVTLFDCIEFNNNLRWIDVISEAAFLVMDLHDRRRPDLAWRFLNAYLEISGDYAGIKVLRYYLTYRAMVRAKIACIRATQAGLSMPEQTEAWRQFRSYLMLAHRFTQPAHPMLIINHGLSGSGKSTATQTLLEHIGAPRIRSDVERKRLFGLAAQARSNSGINAGLYTADASRMTYQRLAELAHALLENGYNVIIDATFLKRGQRDLLREVAHELHAPFVILDFQASTAVLRERVEARHRLGLDAAEADVAVLEQQIASHEPLEEDELAATVAINTEQALDIGAVCASMESIAP